MSIPHVFCKKKRFSHLFLYENVKQNKKYSNKSIIFYCEKKNLHHIRNLLINPG